MRVLVTVSDIVRIAILIDLRTGVTRAIPGRARFIDPTIVGRVPARPFGISWTSQELFIANNKQLLVFDQRLSYLRTEMIQLKTNVHQLARHDDRIWAVSTSTNSLIGVGLSSGDALEFDLLTGRISTYIARETTPTQDVHHFNSLLWTSDTLFVAAHNLREPSFINCYDAKTLELTHVKRDVGYAIHGLAHHSDELFWVSTDTWEVRSDNGFRLRLPRDGYSRGFAVTDQYMIVATSDFLARNKRTTGNSRIGVYSRSRGTLLAEFRLKDTGSINDLRLLDEFDYAHGIESFWPSEAAHASTPERFPGESS